MQVLIITNTIHDILGFAYLKNISENIRLSGIITSGGHTRLKRLFVKTYLKELKFPDWNSIPIFATTNEPNDEYSDIDNKNKNFLLSLLNTKKKSIIELENDCIFPSFYNEYEFIKSLDIQKGSILCFGQLTPLYNAYMINNDVLSFFDSIFIQGNLLIGSESPFAEITEYYHSDSQIISVGIDPHNSYNFCGVWNKHNRELVDKHINDVETLNLSNFLLKNIYQKTNIQLYFIGNYIAENIVLLKEQLMTMEYIIYDNPLIDDKYYPTDALTVSYFDSVYINKTIRDSLKFIMFEIVYFKIKVIGNINKNFRASNLSINLMELIDSKKEKLKITSEKININPENSIWWKGGKK